MAIDPKKLAERTRQFQTETLKIWSGAEHKLEDVLAAVSEELYGNRTALFSILATEGSKLVQTPENIAAVNKVYDETLALVKSVLKVSGYGWVENWVNRASLRGVELAEWSLEGFGDLVRNREVLLAAFKNFNQIDSMILTSGLEEGYRILDTYGTDIADYFRRETLRAIIEGIPVQSLPGSKADSLARRIWEGGRIGKGKLPSIVHRAVTIARIELPRIENATYTQKAQEAGLEWGINVNPLDERTTPICEDASAAGPMTYQDWLNTYGLPPRINPFHLCRSNIIWGEKRWLTEEAA